MLNLLTCFLKKLKDLLKARTLLQLTVSGSYKEAKTVLKSYFEQHDYSSWSILSVHSNLVYNLTNLQAYYKSLSHLMQFSRAYHLRFHLSSLEYSNFLNPYMMPSLDSCFPLLSHRYILLILTIED